MPNSWVDGDKAKEYLGRADTLPHRGEGEGVLVRDLAGALPGRVLDLGCGDGRLTALVLAAYPESTRPLRRHVTTDAAGRRRTLR